MDKNLIQRCITGSLFVIVLVGCIIGHPLSFGGLFLLITILGLWEFYGLAEKAGAQPLKTYGTLVGAFLFALAFLAKRDHNFALLLAVLPMIFLVFFAELYRKKDHPFTNIAFTLTGILYVALPFALWCLVIVPTHTAVSGWLSEQPLFSYRWHLFLGFFILMWTSDTMAYVCGRLFGKHKLFERISPKKTWEGTIGGGLFALGAAFLVAHFWKDIELVHWLVIAGIVVVCGNLGDLTESLFKRSINIKDSGNILPGHGGILDRFDAALLASPFVACYLLFIPSVQ
ncbi:MAG: CDP-diglyceride synthetase [Bacteroidetes bacterium]|nr:MAG: CDP-diglyceride synthetase [Bacteroidota bacterium]